MGKFRLGYDKPIHTLDILSDGSEVHGMALFGDREIKIHCIDEQTALNLISVWDHGVVDVDVS